MLRYSAKTAISQEEQRELKDAGFSLENDNASVHYQKTIDIAGRVYPAIEISRQNFSKLTQQPAIHFYDTQASPPSIAGKLLNAPIVMGAVILDIAASPVYLFVSLGVILSDATR